MSPTTTVDPTQPPPQPPPAQPPRSSFSCDKHPHEQFNGFCPECLFERLTTLDQSTNNNPSSSSSSSVLKSLFSKPTKHPSFFPELRRTKSFSASKNEALTFLGGSSFEPQRKSCDVRGRSTLWSLFSLDEGEVKNCCSNLPVKEEEDLEIENVGNETTTTTNRVRSHGWGLGRLECTQTLPLPRKVERLVNEITEVESEIVEEVNEDIIIKPMKDHIDLDSVAKKTNGGGGRDLKEIAGSFLTAASVFSKKWHNWRRKQKMKKRDNGGENSSTLTLEKTFSRRKCSRDAQSEIADYGFGRRSCDTEPRFSLDIGRISIDDPRYSFDEPRASCDAHFVGRSVPRMVIPPMVSVIEDAPVMHVARTDSQIVVEEVPVVVVNDDGDMPGGSAQTRDYYLDSSSRRRKSLDRSNSIRKTAAAIVAEIDEMKSVSSNAKVLPERDLNLHSNPNSLRDDYSETFELTGFGDNGSGIGNGERKGLKKSKKWGWNIWGFIHRKGNGNKDEEDDKYSRSNGVERSFSGSWQDIRRDTNGDLRGGGLNRNMFRSNSSVSWRNSTNIGGKKKDDFVLERNRSAKYSPNHTDNRFLRFHFAPMRGSRRNLPVQSRPNGSHSIGRNVLRLY